MGTLFFPCVIPLDAPPAGDPTVVLHEPHVGVGAVAVGGPGGAGVVGVLAGADAAAALAVVLHEAHVGVGAVAPALPVVAGLVVVHAG